jgi:YgiT-type zinc finger domain-containing protein
MMCVICKSGELEPGKVTVTLTRARMTLVIRSMPARVCENCCEEYVDAVTASGLLQTLEGAARAGVEVDVREYMAA